MDYIPMKFILLVIFALMIAAGAALYFQPNLISSDILARLPLPEILVFSPRAGQKVDLAFTVSGYAKSLPVPVYITNSKDIEIFSTTINQSKFRPGDQINLVVGPPLSPLTITLTIK